MTRYIARRAALLLLTLWLVSIGVFVITQVLPGDVATHVLGQSATPDTVAAMRNQLDLNHPAPVLYARWLSGFVTGQWGQSLALRVPLQNLVLSRLANSAVLAALAALITVPLSILGGVVAALNRDRWPDRLISVVGLSGIAIPEFVSGVFLVVVFSIWLHIAPSSANIPPDASPLAALPSLILPALSLVLVLFAYISRMTRASTIEVLGSDYVRTAVLKGLPRRRVLVHHVLRNSLLPTVTVVGSQIGWLVGGLVVVENLFGYPGIGSLLLFGALNKDVPLLETCVMLIAAIYGLSNLAADVLYALLNPRIRYT